MYFQSDVNSLNISYISYYNKEKLDPFKIRM